MEKTEENVVSMDFNNPFMSPLFNFQNWKSGDEKKDTANIEQLLKFLKAAFPEMNAGQLKSFLFVAMSEIDKCAHI